MGKNHHIISYHIISYHIISYHIISYHISSYLIISHIISMFKKMEVMILLMEEILHHLVNNGINYLSTGAGFLPSTVWYTIYAGGITFQGLAAQNANL